MFIGHSARVSFRRRGHGAVAWNSGKAEKVVSLWERRWY